jgi:pimeloyl-ACP methyl ester carboxylesterase
MLALSSAAAGGLAVGGTGAVAAADADSEREDVTIESHDGTEIAMTVYRPGTATADDPVPMILHSHGWSGSRTASEGAFSRELDSGYGVLSFDQRGHGDSGGQAYIQNPDREGRDVIEVLDYVAGLEWVARSPGRSSFPTPEDPMVFAIGGSYGGAYQLVGALTETKREGDTRFDALAPQITWFDLSNSLAPAGVVRSAWVAALYAAGALNVPEHVHRGVVFGFLTGQWPEGQAPGVPDLESRFSRNGPSGFVDEGIQLDIPVLFGQGASDNLFNLNQGWKNFERTLTDRARRRSSLVSYNGGHALPNALPPGQAASGDACSGEGGFGALRLAFFEAVRDQSKNPRDVVGSPYSLTTARGGSCLQVDALDDRTTLAGGFDMRLTTDPEGGLELQDVAGIDEGLVGVGDVSAIETDPEAVEAAFEGVDAAFTAGAGTEGGTAASPTGVGAPIHVELASGETTVTGVPTVSADVSSLGVEQRLFFALSVGTSPADARVIQNNMMPLREPEPVTGAERTVELPGVAAEIGSGESLYLTVSGFSDMSFAHGSVRTPGVVVLENTTVDVPTLE